MELARYRVECEIGIPQASPPSNAILGQIALTTVQIALSRLLLA